jgi:hypothetical protein
MLDYRGESYWTISVWTYGVIEVQFSMMSKNPPFDRESMRLELRRRLNEIPGVSIPENGINRRPSIRLSILTNEDILNQFLSVLDWVVGQVKEA